MTRGKILRTVPTICIYMMAAACSIVTGGPGEFQPTASLPQKPCLCSPQVARNVGMILFQANPMNEIDQEKFSQVRSFIEGNAKLLQAEGPTVTCAKQLGKALAITGLERFSKRDYDHAYSSVLSQGGTIEAARDVAYDMVKWSVETHSLGEELQWLSTVLSPAANGDWGPYFNTATDQRAQLRQILKMPGAKEYMEIIRKEMAQYKPLMVDQMVMASCLYRR